MILEKLHSDLLAGERRAIARAISYVENDDSATQELMRRVFPHTGNAYRIGMTGPPGAGKSTLTNRLAQHYRRQGSAVGIIAVDPTSPFTGGALLGDRVRMNDISMDEGVFVRSMATRGSLGGLSKKTREAADVLDAAGKDVILIETVGVGQSELEIAQMADTVIVVLVPESGDAIQAMKAGLMEIADFFIMNKSDRDGADQAVTALKTILSMKPRDSGWLPRVVKTIAQRGEGIDEVAGMIASHRQYTETGEEFRRRRVRRVVDRIRELVETALRVDLWTNERLRQIDDLARTVIDEGRSPYDIAEAVLGDFRSNGDSDDSIQENVSSTKSTIKENSK